MDQSGMAASGFNNGVLRNDHSITSLDESMLSSATASERDPWFVVMMSDLSDLAEDISAVLEHVGTDPLVVDDVNRLIDTFRQRLMPDVRKQWHEWTNMKELEEQNQSLFAEVKRLKLQLERSHSVSPKRRATTDIHPTQRAAVDINNQNNEPSVSNRLYEQTDRLKRLEEENLKLKFKLLDTENELKLRKDAAVMKPRERLLELAHENQKLIQQVKRLQLDMENERDTPSTDLLRALEAENKTLSSECERLEQKLSQVYERQMVLEQKMATVTLEKQEGSKHIDELTEELNRLRWEASRSVTSILGDPVKVDTAEDSIERLREKVRKHQLRELQQRDSKHSVHNSFTVPSFRSISSPLKDVSVTMSTPKLIEPVSFWDTPLPQTRSSSRDTRNSSRRTGGQIGSASNLSPDQLHMYSHYAPCLVNEDVTGSSSLDASLRPRKLHL
eukprot:GILJ01011841.1.p1 GENE.GILJ01011841.1~~GILJ01011841.1.p1  ORF type:complete len:488 (-),score=87.40 GILJ01011841.1:42-1379(-)